MQTSYHCGITINVRWLFNKGSLPKSIVAWVPCAWVYFVWNKPRLMQNSSFFLSGLFVEPIAFCGKISAANRRVLMCDNMPCFSDRLAIQIKFTSLKLTQLELSRNLNPADVTNVEFVWELCLGQLFVHQPTLANIKTCHNALDHLAPSSQISRKLSLISL